jgi:hypothetical protein
MQSAAQSCDRRHDGNDLFPNRSRSPCSSIVRATPRRKRGHQAAHALPIARLSIQHSVVLDAPSAAKRFALAKLSPATTAIRLAGLRAMTRLLMGEPDLWWAYHSKIEYPANHRCRIAGFEPAVSRAGDVRQGGGGANPRRATCSTSLPLANLAPAARRPSRCCFCLFHSTIVASFLDRLAGIACSDGERLQDQVRDRIRV